MLYTVIYIQQDATLHSLFYLETALHVSGGTSTYYQERIQLYLQHLAFVTTLLLPAASGMGCTQTCIPVGHLHKVTYTKCCIDTINFLDYEHMGARNM